MISASMAVVLASLTAGPVCGTAGDGPRILLDALNEARIKNGLSAVEPHPALCESAAWRASSVAARGLIETSLEVLQETSQRLHRGGYASHRWIEGTLIGSRDGGVLEQWQEANPRWFADALEGDFEHVGIGFARYRSQPVYTLLLALSQRTEELRQARPLGNLEWVRRVVLDAVNAAREEHRLRPVEPDPLLDETAQGHAEDMLRRAYYAHESPEGKAVGWRARAAGFRIRGAIGENIAKGLFRPEETVRRWLDSPGHRRNILRRRAKQMGVGVAFGDNDNGFEVIWVQVFGG